MERKRLSNLGRPARTNILSKNLREAGLLEEEGGELELEISIFSIEISAHRFSVHKANTTNNIDTPLWPGRAVGAAADR